MPDIDLLTISREEAVRVARAVFGMSPTEAEEFVTLARGEETSDIEPQAIEVKALGGFAEGLHPRIPAGQPKGGQFARKAGKLLKKGLRAYQAYNRKTAPIRQAEGSALAGFISGTGSYNTAMGLGTAIMGHPTIGLTQASLGLLERSAGEALYRRVGKRHVRNKRIYNAVSMGTVFGRAFGPGFKRGFGKGFQRVRAQQHRAWQQRLFRNARTATMSTVRGLPAPKNYKPPRIINLPKSKYRFYEVGMKAKKLPKLGTGARFAKLEGELSKKGIRDPGALAAAIGRKKYGAKRFAKLSAHGRKEFGFKAIATTHMEPKPILQIALEMRNKLPKGKKNKKGHKPFPKLTKTKAFGAYDEAKHKRYPKGSPKGGKFMPKGGGGGASTSAGFRWNSKTPLGAARKAMRPSNLKKTVHSALVALAGKPKSSGSTHWKLSSAARGTRWKLRTVTKRQPKPRMSAMRKDPKIRAAAIKRYGTSHKESIPGDWPTGHILAQPMVFKDVNDNYRWVLLSSNGYRDRDGELITTKALERDVALWELEGQPYQPLRWWHVALDDTYQHGLELGQTDLRTVYGHTLIESGTFDDPVIGEAVFKAQDELAASVGFRHSPNQPNADKMFEDVSIFERSLLPEAFSSNVLTDLIVTN